MEPLQSLITQAQNGDIDAFGTIVTRFQDMAVGYAYSILGDFHLAQDAAQEAFISAFRDLKMLREPSAFPAWFRRLIFKQCNRLTRGRRLKTEPLEIAMDAVGDKVDPVAMMIERESQEHIWSAIDALPENERVATTLFYICGYSQKEIADFLEVPSSTINGRLQTARRRMKVALMDASGERIPQMARENLKENLPSKDDRFVNQVQLFNAVEAGQVEKAKALLSATPALVNAENSSGQTPLHVAAYYGYKEIVELLLAGGAAVDARDNVGSTLLHHMAQGYFARLDVTELLLAHGADIDATDSMGRTPASLAAYYEMERDFWVYNRLRKFLLEKGASPDIFLMTGTSEPPGASETEKIEALLKADPTQVNARLKSADGTPGATPLHFAVRQDYKPIPEILLKYGADPNALDDRRRPPLYLVGNDPLTAELLLAHGAELDIFSASAIGRTELVTQLLSDDPSLIHAKDAGGNTPLHLAVWKRKTEMVKLLLAKGADPNLQNARGETPVSLALDRLQDLSEPEEVYKARACEIRRLLIQGGAKCDIWTAAQFGSVEALDACLRDNPALLNAPNDEGFTPLQLAAHDVYWDSVETFDFQFTPLQSAVEFLLSKGATLDICTAARLGKLEHVKALLGADPTLVNHRTVDDYTPLHLAVGKGHEEVVKYLAKRGAALDFKNVWCRTPLILAWEIGHKPIVEFLIEQSADVNAGDRLNVTLLHRSVFHRSRVAFVEWLVSHGADIHARDWEYNNTPIHYAARRGYIELVQFFLEQGADINDVGTEGWTPLHMAGREGHTKIVQLLLERGASVNVKSNQGETPLQLAIQKGHEDVAALLRQHGATE